MESNGLRQRERNGSRSHKRLTEPGQHGAAKVPMPLPQTIFRRETTMRPGLESAAKEVERLTALRDAAEKGSAEHRELNHQLIKARRRLYEVEWGRRDLRR